MDVHKLTMHISPKQLEKFKSIYKQEFRVELSDCEAHEKGMRLLLGFKAIYRPITKEQYQRLQEEEN